MPINPEAKLVGAVLDREHIEKQPTRNGYGQGLVEAGIRNPNIVALSADLTESTRTQVFKDKFPERFLELGVAEQNMASVASGLAAVGKVPFIASYAMFSPGRNWEQIRTTICYNEQNVKIAGAHAGVSVGPDGATHQAIEDIAIMRPIANMTVLVPCDAEEARKATVIAAEINGPVYLRFAREKTPVFTTSETPFSQGKAAVFWNEIHLGAPDAVIFGCGPLLYHALQAAADLEKEGIGVRVVNIASIKPLDEPVIIQSAKDAGAAVTVEEHQVAGGMGSAVAEVLARLHPVPIEFIGVQNRFGESGLPSELLEKFGMGISHVKEAVKRVIARKQSR